MANRFSVPALIAPSEPPRTIRAHAASLRPAMHPAKAIAVTPIAGRTTQTPTQAPARYPHSNLGAWLHPAKPR